MKTMKTKQKQRWATLLVTLGMALLGISLWIYTPEQAYADDEPATSADAAEAQKAEWAILEQKARTDELTPTEEKRRRWLGGQFMQRILDASLGRFTLEGVVVDEQGNPLDKVSLRISKEKMTGFEQWKEDKEEKIINGTFSVTARGYDIVRLYAKKDGYYQESLDFLAPSPGNIRGQPKEPVVDKRNIRIVMEKKGDITSLLDRNVRLTYRREDEGASGYVVNFDRAAWIMDSNVRNYAEVDNLLDLEQIPSMCMYMIPKVDDDGRILNEDKGGANSFRPCLMPQEMRLITNDPEGGLIVYEQEKGESAFWSMKLAPETGYKQEIILDADLMFRRSPYVTSDGDDGIYFYYKADGRYGKGRIGPPKFPEGDYALELGVKIRSQKDGSRNLDTGRR